MKYLSIMKSTPLSIAEHAEYQPYRHPFILTAKVAHHACVHGYSAWSTLDQHAKSNKMYLYHYHYQIIQHQLPTPLDPVSSCRKS